MGIFNDIKKLIFGSKAVTKSTAKKTSKYIKEKGEHLHETSDELIENTKNDLNNKFDDIKTQTEEKSTQIIENIADKSKEVINNITDSKVYKKSTEAIEKVGDIIADTGEKFIDEAKDFIDGPGKEVADKFKDTSEVIGRKIIKGGSTIYDKATEITKNLGEKMDETIQKAEEYAKTKKEKANDSEFADTPFDIKDSELTDKDDFFDKADKYASGEYSDNPKARILEDKIESKKEMPDIDGFEDRDNDGNPLIDEADVIEDNTEVEKQEENKKDSKTKEETRKDKDLYKKN
jgi:hypothetical protein